MTARPAKRKRGAADRRGGRENLVRTLAIDIGGTGTKAVLLDERGEPISQRARVETPRPATPEAILGAIEGLAAAIGSFERVSAGFPGVVRRGVTETAPNLGPEWEGFDLASALAERLQRPARVANDADVQGFAVVVGKGVELVLTLGTGLGSALFLDGRLVPNLEVAHHRFRAGKTYEDTLGKRALDRAGKRKWNKRLLRAIEELRKLFNYDLLHLGGGNAKKIDVELPKHATVGSNFAGLLGGIALWREPPHGSDAEPPASAKRRRVESSADGKRAEG